MDEQASPGASPVHQKVRPVCWVNINKQGDVTHHSNKQMPWAKTPLYDQAALDAAAVAGQVERSIRPGADVLLRTMDCAGWALDWVDMDLTGAAPKLEIRASRHDGLWLRAYVDELGRATVERFRRERRLGMRDNEKGRRPMTPLVDDRFMGRQQYVGARALMRGLCAYLTDNALHPIELSDMRAAWAALMQAPARIARPNDSAQRLPAGHTE